MDAYAESAASFRHRCTEIGLSAAEINALETQNLKTFNNLAFAVCGQPGQLDAGRFQQVMDGAFHAPTIGLESMMRQLSYEAITVAVAAIRLRVEPQQEGQIKRLPPQERDERIRKQAAAITGFTIQGDYEPAHAGRLLHDKVGRKVHRDTCLCPNASAESRSYNRSALTCAWPCSPASSAGTKGRADPPQPKGKPAANPWTRQEQEVHGRPSQSS